MNLARQLRLGIGRSAGQTKRSTEPGSESYVYSHNIISSFRRSTATMSGGRARPSRGPRKEYREIGSEDEEDLEVGKQ